MRYAISFFVTIIFYVFVAGGGGVICWKVCGRACFSDTPINRRVRDTINRRVQDTINKRVVRLLLFATINSIVLYYIHSANASVYCFTVLLILLHNVTVHTFSASEKCKYYYNELGCTCMSAARVKRCRTMKKQIRAVMGVSKVLANIPPPVKIAASSTTTVVVYQQ